MTVPSTRARSSVTTVLSHPALERRSALRDRRPQAVRRHTARVATRFTVLLAGDFVAVLVARAVAFWLLTATAFGSASLPDSPLTRGPTRFTFVVVITLIAVFTTG